MPVSYSSNALATFSTSLIYMSVFFHAYRARSLSYFLRMRDHNRELALLGSRDMLTGLFNARAYYAACQ